MKKTIEVEYTARTKVILDEQGCRASVTVSVPYGARTAAHTIDIAEGDALEAIQAALVSLQEEYLEAGFGGAQLAAAEARRIAQQNGEVIE